MWFCFCTCDYPVITLLLIFTLIPLWSENTFSHFMLVDICPVTQMLSILVYVLCILENNVYSAISGWSIPETIRSSRLGVLFSSSIFLLIFCLLVLPLVKKRVLTSSTIVVDVSISYFSSISLYFTCFATLLTHTHLELLCILVD